MPAKLDDASNLRFLYACLAHSNYTAVNYDRVANLFGIKGPAARMRFTRLKEQLDPEQRIGHKHVKISKIEARRRRQKERMKQAEKEGYEPDWKGRSGRGYGASVEEGEDDDEEMGWGMEGIKKQEEVEDDVVADGEEEVDSKPSVRRHIDTKSHPPRQAQDMGRFAPPLPPAWHHGPYAQDYRRPQDGDNSAGSGPKYPPPVPQMMHWTHPYYAPPPPSSDHALVGRQVSTAYGTRYPSYQQAGTPYESQVPGAAFEFGAVKTGRSGHAHEATRIKEPVREELDETPEMKLETESTRSSTSSVIHVNMHGSSQSD